MKELDQAISMYQLYQIKVKTQLLKSRKTMIIGVRDRYKEI